ncbi:MAG: hypothetical protein KN64_04570 [Sulfurovum sp. AS07-7]|nr:MAG: hypothetical protein KN64_04570 [Sulfurovum sp. AS07-7]
MKIKNLFFTLFMIIISSLGLYAQATIEYSYVPKKVYEHQVIPISFVGTNISDADILKFGFYNALNQKIMPILEEPTILKSESKTFYTFYFKASTQGILYVPVVSLIYNGKENILNGFEIKVQTLPAPKSKNKFSGIIASNLKVKTSQATIFDEKSNLLTLSLDANDANLEDIISYPSTNDGVENIKRKDSRVEGKYFLILPQNKKEFIFTYFNSVQEKYLEIVVPVVINNNVAVAAQEDLNPRNDEFEDLKKYSLMFLLLLFIALFVLQRKKIYIVFAIIALLLLIKAYMPHAKICVKEGADMFVVPTSSSTVGGTIQEESKVTKLGENNGYTKIEYKDGVIGWIKDEDICKN